MTVRVQFPIPLAASMAAWTIGLAVVCGAPPVLAQFSSRTEAVRIDVLVTEQNKTVARLTPADFEVTDNGVAQRVDLLSFDQVPLNVVLALDLSSSLSGDRLMQLKAACRRLVGQLKAEDQAALVTFTEVIRPGTGLTTDVGALLSEIGQTDTGGRTRGTALVDAIYAATVVAESDVGRALVVVFSDGVDSSSWLLPAEMIAVAQRSDAVVYAVVTRHSGRSAFVEDLTHTTAGSLFEVEATEDLEGVFVGILNEFRQRYLLSYTPTGPRTPGWHKVEVRVKGRAARVKARPGYWIEQSSNGGAPLPVRMR